MAEVQHRAPFLRTPTLTLTQLREPVDVRAHIGVFLLTHVAIIEMY
jgi:hypothetical protein